MAKLQTLRRIREIGVISILRARKQEDAIAIAHAIREGEVPVLEITMTVPGAIEVIRQLVATLGNQVIIGAGTVLDPETARTCILAGAEFIVSPALKLATIEICHRYAVPVFPGALTPTEVLTAWEAGADAVKVFPCGSMFPYDLHIFLGVTRDGRQLFGLTPIAINKIRAHSQRECPNRKKFRCGLQRNAARRNQFDLRKGSLQGFEIFRAAPGFSIE
jgi:2-keto-3-deoxy-6-phosphogluconate aldolase